MVLTKGRSYVGIALDDIDMENAKTRTSGYSRLSDTGLLKHQTRRQRDKAILGVSSRLRRVLTRDFWQQAIPQSKSFFLEAFVDLKGFANWRSSAWRLCTLLGPLLFLVGIASILPLVSSRKLYQLSNACQPDSGFYVGYQEYDIWDLSGFFQITLGFGDFSFSMAKTIDVGWDVIVGRGGQAVLAAVSFAVYSKALVRSMESSPVSYGTFEAVTLQSGSLTASIKLARDLFKNKTAQARAAVVWIVISALFVLAFPTILSAMSGYSVNIGSFVEVDNGNMVVYTNFTLVRYVVHDAYRIEEALGKDYSVTTGGNVYENGEISLQYDQNSDYCAGVAFLTKGDNNTLDWSSTAEFPMCDLYWHVSEYAYHYGLLGLGKVDTTFNYSGKLVNLTQPSLNITAIFWQEDWILSETSNGTDWWLWPYGYYWSESNGNQPFHNFSDPIFTNGQYTYDLAELNLRGRCQQEGVSYRWGFSFLALFTFVVIFLVWCVGMYALWLDAFLHSRFDRVGRSMGLQRAILDLAYAMHRDLDESGRDMLSNQELQGKIRRDLKGGRITYEMLDPTLLPVSRATEWRLKWRAANKRQWLLARKDWLLASNRWMLAFCILSLGFLAAALAGTHTPLFTAFLLSYGSGTVLVMGEKHKSRWLIFIACLILAIILAPIGPYVYLDRNHYAIIWLRQSAYNNLEWWYNQ